MANQPSKPPVPFGRMWCSSTSGLPGIDGYEVARKLRREEGFHDTTIIAITGYGSEDGESYSMTEGFDHHLIKPVQIDYLVALLEKPRVQHADGTPQAQSAHDGMITTQ